MVLFDTYLGDLQVWGPNLKVFRGFLANTPDLRGLGAVRRSVGMNVEIPSDVSLPRSGQPFWLVVNLFQPIRSTTQIWGSETSSVWKFCTCSLDGISWGNQWWRWGASSGQNTMKVRWDGPAFESYWFFTCSSTTLIYNGLLLHRYLSARAHSGMLSRAHTMLLVQCRWPLTFWVGRG